ncbi:response regulator [Verrucomicrobiota bacterium]|nr:response regulator [Verrucomicrobiota bacterium]
MNKHRILIVDDEHAITRMVKLNLESTGRYEVRGENSSVNALAVAREFRPDLVLLDVIMPGADGGEIAARMKNDAVLRQVPIVFLTATVSPKEAGKGGLISAGMKFLAKPVSLATLVGCLEEFLGKPTEATTPAVPGAGGGKSNQ